MQRARVQSNSLLDERVRQSMVDRQPLGRVQDKDLLEEILELSDLADLVLWHPLAADHVGHQVLARTNRTHHRHFLLHTVHYTLATLTRSVDT